jgi:multicomponent Na+:H+ antiporter subunit G
MLHVIEARRREWPSPRRWRSPRYLSSPRSRPLTITVREALRVLDCLAVVLLGLGLVITTIGVNGVLRMPEVYSQLHPAGITSGFDVFTILLASIATRDVAVITHAVLVIAFLTITAPLAATPLPAPPIAAAELRPPRRLSRASETRSRQIRRGAIRFRGKQLRLPFWA